ncbi:hypothetical protein CLIB1423_16S01530 [[Candida] railenensis]|uniref:Uncharacterized protein n=1 Tax=[Candida] railenensis TaxID=45579 RepID=A0A9P0QTD5_9ASCO|nr:hypothetical protein CLIB1423_16S01530 [[Candida] railenensis]
MDDFKGVFSARNDPLKLNQMKEWMSKSKAENLIPSYDQAKSQLVTNLKEIKVAASSIQRGDTKGGLEMALDESSLSIQSTTVVKEVTVTHSVTETITRFMTNVETSTETYHDVVTHTTVETSRSTDASELLEVFGSTGKDVLNSKNPSHKLSINPQFSYHSKEGYQEGNSYSKPKISPLSSVREFVSSDKLVGKAFGINDGDVEVLGEDKAEGKVDGEDKNEGDAVASTDVVDGTDTGVDATRDAGPLSEFEGSVTESSTGTNEDDDNYTSDHINNTEDRSNLQSSRQKTNVNATSAKTSMVSFSLTAYTNSTVTTTSRVPSRWRAVSLASTDESDTGRHLRKIKSNRRNHTRPEFHLFRINNESSQKSINVTSLFAAFILAIFTVLLL